MASFPDNGDGVNVQPSTTRTIKVKPFCVVIVILGIASISTQSAILAFMPTSIKNSTHGIWAGLLYIVTGCMSMWIIWMSKRRSATVSLVFIGFLSFVASLIALLATWINFLDLIFDVDNTSKNYPQCYSTWIALESTLLAISFLSAFITAFLFVHSNNGLRISYPIKSLQAQQDDQQEMNRSNDEVQLSELPTLPVQQGRPKGDEQP